MHDRLHRQRQMTHGFAGEITVHLDRVHTNPQQPMAELIISDNSSLGFETASLTFEVTQRIVEEHSGEFFSKFATAKTLDNTTVAKIQLPLIKG